jgi:hypothetical protein
MNGPYRLITTDDPCKTLAQGELRYFARIIDAANAFAKADEPWKTVNYDDGREARELNRDEQWMLESVSGILRLRRRGLPRKGPVLVAASACRRDVGQEDSKQSRVGIRPICELCDRTLANEVHHKVAMEDGGAKYDLDNLVSTCKPCHSREHAGSRRRGGSCERATPAAPRLRGPLGGP